MELYIGKQPSGPYCIENTTLNFVKHLIQILKKKGKNKLKHWDQLCKCVHIFTNRMYFQMKCLKEEKFQLIKYFNSFQQIIYIFCS